MGCHMPEIDGFQATAAIRSRESAEKNASRSGGGLPINALRTNAMEGDRERCLAAGMHDYLPKPFRKEQLERMLKNWIRDPAPARAFSAPGS
jgi:two-component system, sensor histidine kinase and response regulator